MICFMFAKITLRAVRRTDPRDAGVEAEWLVRRLLCHPHNGRCERLSQGESQCRCEKGSDVALF